MKEVITLTLNTALDCVITEEEYERFGACPERLEIIPAGKGINVSRALSSWDFSSLCLGFVGIEDKEIFSSVDDENITTDFVYVSGNTRKNITITNCKDGLEHHERNKGFTPTKENVEELLEKLEGYCDGAKYLVLSGSVPDGISKDIYKDIIFMATKKGLKVILDASGPALNKGIEAGPYMIKPNLEELKSLTDENLDSKEAIENFIRKTAVTNSIEYVLTTLSQEGALLYVRSADRFIYSPAYKDDSTENKQIVSSVGCGDCSLAGFLYGNLKKLSFDGSLEMSMKCAAYNLYTKIPGKLGN
ncbi:MAG: 1-phosphofructokinase family hexose kinase [Lachnospiraceae bacterium]|nr:1-phosphofructokinase family hexose kinase [Lachnospiraceae bacterium]